MNKNAETINSQIAALKYDPKQILAFEGNIVSNVRPKEGQMKDSEYIVVTREVYNIQKAIDLAVPCSNNALTYPGALLLANSYLVDGKPQALGAQPGRNVLSVDLPGLAQDGSVGLSSMTYANVKSALNQILNTWLDNYSKDYNAPAIMTYTSSLLHDEKEMQLKFGCDVGFLEDALGIGLGADINGTTGKKKSNYLVSYKQIYYTASVQSYAEPADAFSYDTTWNDLVNLGVNNDNPPAYVGSVVYGREIYINFESDCEEHLFEEAINAAVSIEGVDVGPEKNDKYSDVYKNTRFSYVIMGGSVPESFSGFDMNEDNARKVNGVIFSDTQFSKENPGIPLNYRVAFLKENQPAVINGTTQYVDEKIERFSSGELELEHQGAYVAKFTVSWQEITGYDEDGKEKTATREWPENGKHKTASFDTRIALGGNVRRINVKAEGATGLVWEPWRTSLDKKDLALGPHIHVKIWGTTLSQKSSCTYED